MVTEIIFDLVFQHGDYSYLEVNFVRMGI